MVRNPFGFSEGVDNLQEKLGFSIDSKKKNSVVFDLGGSTDVASTILQTKFQCVDSVKDSILYYFSFFYPGKTLVFVNAINSVRKLVSFLQVLGVPAWGLQSQMQQRQRLKNLDQFKNRQNAILVCTDVAARGLDIPNVDHVIQYHLPRSSETYVHRCGRTGRAGKKGFSLLLGSEQEIQRLEGFTSDHVTDFEVRYKLLEQLEERVRLSHEIEKLNHSDKKSQKKKSWILEKAEAMDLIVDEDLIEKEDESTSFQAKKHATKLASLQAQLKTLLKEEIGTETGKRSKFVTIRPDLHLKKQQIADLVPPLFSSE